jgi:hypothetical protein
MKEVTPPQGLWKGWLQINPRFHHEYMEITCQEFGRDIWHKSMFNSPCKCCGSNEHALLKITNDESTQIKFDCSVICHDEVGNMLKEEHRDKMYKPCPEKFASLYGYQSGAVIEALKQFDNMGVGKYWDWSSCMEFSEKTLDACANYQRQGIFKRDQSLECYYAGEIEFALDEDDSSATA